MKFQKVKVIRKSWMKAIFMKGECLSAVINAANLAVERMDGRTIGVQSAKWKFIGFFYLGQRNVNCLYGIEEDTKV